MDDGCDAILCCLCAPLAALFCCKLCKDKSKSQNGVSPEPDVDFDPSPNSRGPAPPKGYDQPAAHMKRQPQPFF